MAYTLRHVSRLAHMPVNEKFLTGETNRGIGSVKKMAQEAAKRKAAETKNRELDGEPSELATDNS